MTEPLSYKTDRHWHCGLIPFLCLYCIFNSVLFQGPLYVRAVQTLGRIDLGALLALTSLFVLQLAVSLLVLTIVSLISVRLMKWACVALVLGNSVALYFIVSYGVVLDKAMM